MKVSVKVLARGGGGKLWPSVTTGQLPPTCVWGEIKGWGTSADDEENPSFSFSSEDVIHR